MKVSRLSSKSPEHADWRYRQSVANARIEGVEPNPKYEDFVKKLRADGVSENDILKQFIEKVKR